MPSQTSSYSQHRRVCMLVYNNFKNDSRVKKEAQTLISTGYQVTVLALLDADSRPFENIDSIRVVRVPVNPLNLRLSHWIQNFQLSRSIKQGFNYFFSHVSGRGLVPKKTSPNLNRKIQIKQKLVSNLVKLVSIKKTLIIFSLIYLSVVSVNFFYAPATIDWINQNKFKAYSLCGMLALISLCASNFMKRVKHFTTNSLKYIKLSTAIALKRLLMPFHRPFCFLSFYWNAFIFASGYKFEIFHAHDLNTLPVAFLCSRRHKAKLVYDSHELYVERNKVKPSSKTWKFLLGKLEKILVKRTDAVITVNESIAKEMAVRYKIKAPGIVMNTPAPLNSYNRQANHNGNLRSKLSISKQYNIIVYVGAITFNRGLETLLQSLYYLENCYLVCIGYGSDKYKQELFEVAVKNHVAHRFTFFGPVPSDLVVFYASGADLGVAPILNACLSYYLCSPNKLFEYMNAGLPVVASNFPELEKIVLGHNIGLTFDPSNPREIAQSIETILKNQILRKTMANNAIVASSLYNWEKESKKLLQIYDSLK